MSRKLRVLMVEDLKRDADLLVRALRFGGYEPVFERVDTAMGMKASLQKRAWDIVLCDYSMPQFDAPAAIALVRRKDPDIPVIVVSAGAGEEAAAEAMRAGAADYLRKDQLTRLGAVIERELREAEHRRQGKRAEEALRESEGKLDAMLRSMSDCIIMVDKGYDIVWANDSARETFGADLLGRKCYAACRARETPCEAQPCLVRRAFEDGRIHEQEMRLIAKDGRALDFACTANVALRDEAGRPGAVMKIGRDVTASKEAEQALEKSRAQFFQSQKLEAVGRLAGGIAHDFNNLLTAIGAYADFLLQDMKGDDPKRDDVLEIKNAGSKAAALTRQLLAFSRKQVLRLEVVDLNAVIADLEKLLRRTISEDISFVTVLSPALGHVKADAAQLEQVILNLAVNAGDAMPHGGKLVVETSNAQLREPLACEQFTIPAGRYAMMAVSDTGSGIKADVLPNIFEPFFTTKEKGKGTGLGLSTVYGIVKQLGGYISVYSVEGQGTTFMIYLPATGEMPRKEGGGQAPLAEVRGSETVLLVEDDGIVRKSALRVLGNCGYKILAAANGEEALRMTSRHPERIHLLLTDLVMPGMDGRDLAKRVVSARPGIKVLYMSGYSEEVVAERGMMKPGVSFLQKPFSPYDLARTLRELLDAPSS
ncbi:MAG: response regulator [Elusimicrobiota bacterium]